MHIPARTPVVLSTAALFCLSLFSPLLATAEEKFTVQPVSQEVGTSRAGFNIKNLPIGQLTLVDPYTDVLRNADNTATYRIYSTPRITYTDQTGKLKKRPDAWNLFHNTPKSQLRQNAAGGYVFQAPFNDTSVLQVSSGMQEQGASLISPARVKINWSDSENAKVALLKDVYPATDVSFRDHFWWRDREIIIKSKPGNVSPLDSVVFWENYSLPAGARIFNGSGTEFADGDSISLNGIQIHLPTGERLEISQPIIFDSKEPDKSTAADIYGQPLIYKISLNKTKNQLAVGIAANASYLLDPARVFPVIIDPTYTMCQEGATGLTIQCSSVEDFYIRAADGGANPIGGGNPASTYYNNDLFVGRWLDTAPQPDVNYTRHPIIRFPNVESRLSGNLISASLKLYYRNIGFPTNGGSNYLDLVARRVTRSWTISQIANYTYSTFRGNWVSENPSQRVVLSPSTDPDYVPIGGWITLDVENTLAQWKSGASNQGFLIEQDPEWLSGTTPPSSWENRFLHLDSSRHSSNTSPYLSITLQQIDLTSGGNSTNNVQNNTIHPGDTISGNIHVANNGPSRSLSGGVVKIYLKSGSRVYSDTYLMDSPDLPAINQSSSVNVPYSFQVPFDKPNGTYYVYWWIDATDVSHETDDGNNKFFFSPGFTLQPGGNVYASSASLSPLSLSAGTQMNFGLTMRNPSTSVSPTGQGDVYVYFDAGQTPIYSNKVGQFGLNQLNPGATQSEVFSFTPSTSYAPGNYTFSYFIDAESETNESDENDNRGYFNVTITPAGPPSADFSAFNGRLSSSSQGLQVSSNYITVTARFRNDGPSDATNVGYEMKLIDAQNGQDYIFTTLNPPLDYDIADNATLDVTLRGQIPSNAPFYRNYRVMVTLDSARDYNDSNRGNNFDTTPESFWYEPQNYGGGGGGSPPPPPQTCNVRNLLDSECDGYADVEEKTGGTNVSGSQTMTLYDNNHQQYVALPNDTQSQNYGGDPVNLRTGSFEFTQTDFELPGRGVPIKFERTYNSTIPDFINRLGYGWNFSYNIYYFVDPGSGNVMLNFGNQSAQIYTNNGGTYTPPAGVDATLTGNPSSGFTYKTLEGIQYNFSRVVSSAMGVLESIVDTNGNTTQLVYTVVRDLPLLTTVRDPSGREIQFTYGDSANQVEWDKIKQLVETVNPVTGSRRMVSYTYDGVGNLVTVISNRAYQGVVENIVRRFTYDGAHRLLTYEDARGTILTNVYDTQGQGRVTEQREYNPDRDGGNFLGKKIYTFAYTGPYPQAPNSATCTELKSFRDDASPNPTTYLSRDCYNSTGLLVYRGNQQDEATRFEYTPEGMLSRTIDALGRRTDYQYDGRRRKTQETLPDTTVYPADFRTVNTYQYENNFNRMTQKREQIIRVSDGTGIGTRTTSYGIDPANGNLISITDANNNTETYLYNQFGNMVNFIGKRAQGIQYDYDGNNNYMIREIATVTKLNGVAENLIKRYLYDVYGNRMQYTSPRGFVWNYEHDTRGNLRREARPGNGGVVLHDYDIEDHKIRTTDANGHVTEYTYDRTIPANLVTVRRFGPSGSGDVNNIVTRYEYDFVGNKTKEISPRGFETRSTYDNTNRIITINERGLLTINRQYDAVGNLTQETNSEGQRTDFLYDQRNNQFEVHRYVSQNSFLASVKIYDGWGRVGREADGRGNQRVYQYDHLNRLFQVSDEQNFVTVFHYDADGNRIGIITPRAVGDATLKNSRGYSVSYDYDELNRPMREINAQEKTTEREYDPDGNMIRVIDRRNADGTLSTHITTYQYDELSRKTQETDARGNSIIHAYDPVGNVISASDKNTNQTQFTYDYFDRVETETDPATFVTGYEYDKENNLTRKILPNTTDIDYTYDAKNRKTMIRDARGGEENMSYDGVGNLTSSSDKRGNTTTYQYDLARRLTNERNPQAVLTRYAYDDNGNRLSETTAGKVRQWQYDARNHVTEMREGSQILESYAYDDNGNLSSTTDGNGATINFAYDALDCTTTKTLPGSIVVSYAYDNWNNRISVADPHATRTYQYDLLNRLTIEDLLYPVLLPQQNMLITRSYDAVGNLTQIIDTSSRRLRYAYNSRNLPTDISLRLSVINWAPIVSYAYDSMRRPTEINYGNGVKTEHMYDTISRVTQIKVRDSRSAVLFQHDYLFDPESNITRISDNHGKVTDYHYDNLNQLNFSDSNYVSQGYDESFSYDTWGNRTQLLGAGAHNDSNYTYASASQRLASYTTDRRGVTVTHDVNGNIIQEAHARLGAPVRSIDYSFDPENRLTQVQIAATDRPIFLPAPPANVARYTYSDDGNRIAKEVSGETTFYINDGHLVLNEISQLGGWKTLVTGRDLQQVAEVTNGNQIKYLHQDIMGSTMLMTDEQGAVVQSYEYMPFGEVVGAQGTAGAAETHFQFTGQEFDAESGLIYMNARYYNPALGRFLSRDPVLGSDGDFLSRNPYIYAKNNPLKYRDPTGLWFGLDDLVFTVGGAVVGLIGQGVSDLISGEVSGWEDYVGATLGGAVAGETFLYAAPTLTPIGGGIAAGLTGSATQNAVTQFLKNTSGKQEGYDGASFVTDTALGGVTGLIPGPKGGTTSVMKQIVTKAGKKQISSMTAKTSLKVGVGYVADQLPGEVSGGVVSGLINNFTQNSQNTYCPVQNACSAQQNYTPISKKKSSVKNISVDNK